ncbi:MAG: amino acid permease [Bacillota bacterium]|nr:amino acid permease [Bacillota bacterium]
MENAEKLIGKKTKKADSGDMKWWQLSLFGVGCTIGTGFFLGSSLAIRMAGPSVLISFIMAAFGTYFVFDALSKMTARDPQKGAFRSYAKKAFGRWAGFSSGWVYWCSEMLIMGSQMTALSIFSRFWFPKVPLWVFATGYAILGVMVLLIGVKLLNKVENLLAILKIAAILVFIVIACLAFFGVFNGDHAIKFPKHRNEILPNGVKGIWTSSIYAFYAFGGIEIVGLMAIKLKDPKEGPKAGKIMLFLLTIIYILSIGLAVVMVVWKDFTTKDSPFIGALKPYHLSFVPHLFNGALIIAGFSTMAASLYAVTSILVTLSEDGDAPSIFSKRGKLKVPLPALILTIVGITASIVTALVMPDRIYEYITTAAGLMLLYNWIFILASSTKLLKITAKDKIKYGLGAIFILTAVFGTLFHDSSRPGFFISLLFIGIISIVTFIMHYKWNKKGAYKPQPT